MTGSHRFDPPTGSSTFQPGSRAEGIGRMSGGLGLPATTREPMRAGPQLLQKVGVLSAKAALSSIPWAALVFDIGQLGIDFANARLTDRLLDGIGERIDRLEAGTRERLATDEIYQLSAHAAIRRMLTEANPRMADALARAVVELGASDLPSEERLEIARALDVLTEPSLHLLQTVYRLENDLLTPAEIEVSGDHLAHALRLTALVYASMQLSSWLAPANDLHRAGMAATVSGSSWFAEALDSEMADAGHTVPLFKVYTIGERVVRMCFDDPAIPAFGAFAPETPSGNKGSAGDA